MRSFLDEANKRHRAYSTNQSEFNHLSSQDGGLDDEYELAKLYQLPSDGEVLQRARETHSNVDFESLAAGPEKGGPWRRVEGADRFVVFKRVPSSNSGDKRVPGLEVMCAGRLDASLEEVASVLRSRSEVDHANTMEGLHKKNFIFGSLDREVPCLAALVEEPKNQKEDGAVDTGEQLTIKTASFVRSTLLGRNEQWCFSDFFQRKKERDGFTISQCALPPLEPTPGRVVGANARVDQLHGLNASCLVDKLPNRKGLRVVYNAWFEDALKNIECSTVSTESMSGRNDGRRRSSGLSVSSLSSSSSSSRKSSASSGFMSLSSRAASRRRSSGQSVNSNATLASVDEPMEDKAQLRRLLSLAHGMTRLPGLIRRRRFGVQVPADHDAIKIENTHCPCCTHCLAPVKMSLSMAVSALSKRSLRSLKTDTRRCYLCGYLVCIDCWSAEYMESSVGRVAAIVVCTRCHACVKACDYSEVFASGQEHTRGPPKVVEDPPNESPASLLTDFLAASLMNTSATSADRAAVHSVVRMLLRQSESGTDSENDDQCDRDYDDSFHREVKTSLEELDRFLRDENHLLDVASCTFASSQRRGYVLDLPDEPETAVPPTVIPGHEDARLALANEKGLLQLAYQLAPPDGSGGSVSDVPDLDLLCELAVRASGCPNTFVSIMGTKHLHILSSSNPAFRHTTMPREHGVCQHTILTPKAFMIAHPEADVRFHELGVIKALSTRCYMAFPLIVPMSEDDDETLGGEMPVGTLCCVTPEARSELTRSQYTTLKRLADTASRLILSKGRQLQQQRRAQSIATRGFAPLKQNATH